MPNALSTSRSCQKLLLSGTNSARIQDALAQAAVPGNAQVIVATGGPSIQAEFEEPTLYTVEFRVSNIRDINVPAGNALQQSALTGRITPTATVQWTLGGNTIYRKVSVFSGASISGVCEQLVASVSDETVLPVVQRIGIMIVNASGVLVQGVNTVATANVAGTPPSGLAQVINGVALSLDGMTVLLSNETDPKDNGPYVVHAGNWTRMSPLVTNAHAGGAYMLIVQGTHANEWWQCTEDNGISDVVDTDNLDFGETDDPTYQQQYSLTIVGGEGTRPATSLPPSYQQYIQSPTDGVYRYGCFFLAANTNTTIQIPQDVGITSVMITAGDSQHAGNILDETNFYAEMQQTDAKHPLKNYFPPSYDFVPIPSQARQIELFNASTGTGFEMLVSVVWGIDG